MPAVNLINKRGTFMSTRSMLRNPLWNTICHCYMCCTITQVQFFGSKIYIFRTPHYRTCNFPIFFCIQEFFCWENSKKDSLSARSSSTGTT